MTSMEFYRLVIRAMGELPDADPMAVARALWGQGIGEQNARLEELEATANALLGAQTFNVVFEGGRTFIRNVETGAKIEIRIGGRDGDDQ